ncbi:MAG: hypothetical protein OEL83_02185 [Desulforhopalus sp.]|nr:hypothetical protein [Desulforhopalus sp.]
MEDFAKAIAYEVKQEIASRYFGFRTRIERESEDFLARLKETGQELDARLRLDLCRMQFLLWEPRLFCDFLLLAGLPREYTLGLTKRQNTPLVKELFTAVRGKGFTRWRRFRRLATTIYLSLAEDIAAYYEAYLDLQEEHAEICEEIAIFERNNDLSDILCYLRNLDVSDSERSRLLPAGPTIHAGTSFEQDLRIPLPAPVDKVLTVLKLLPPLNEVDEQFTGLLKQAYTHYDNSCLTDLPF